MQWCKTNNHQQLNIAIVYCNYAINQKNIINKMLMPYNANACKRKFTIISLCSKLDTMVPSILWTIEWYKIPIKSERKIISIDDTVKLVIMDFSLDSENAVSVVVGSVVKLSFAVISSSSGFNLNGPVTDCNLEVVAHPFLNNLLPFASVEAAIFVAPNR